MADQIPNSAKPVAYFYELPGVGKELLLDCNGEYARKLLDAGYTETPLYTRAAPPAMDREAVERLRKVADGSPIEAAYDIPWMVDLPAKMREDILAALDNPASDAEQVTDEMVSAALNAQMPSGSPVLAYLPTNSRWEPTERAKEIAHTTLSTLSADAIRQGEGKVIERAVMDDVIREIYRQKGWTRGDKGGFPTVAARCNSAYTITADPRRNRYVATPIATPASHASDGGKV